MYFILFPPKFRLMKLIELSTILEILYILKGIYTQKSRKLMGVDMESDIIYGNSYSYEYYFANLSFGTPPQLQTLIIDTGSGLVGFPCKGCYHCSNAHFNSPYDLQST